MRERDCKSARCSDGECGYCKRVRKARGERNGKWLIDKMRERGMLQEVMTEAREVAVARVELAASSGMSDLVEWF
jgi:hypothetical protein